tara:strand:- start:61 stop:249 length:189 start_codon:yes stop_codon:yes gene_type:complete
MYKFTAGNRFSKTPSYKTFFKIQRLQRLNQIFLEELDEDIKKLNTGYSKKLFTETAARKFSG